MQLVIVESPTKARTIGKFLGKEYTIKASMGHVMDLPKSKIGIDVEKDFAPQYELIADKKKIIAELKKAAKTASAIILATDPDREGEAIAAHVAEILGYKDTKRLSKDKKQKDEISQYPNIKISSKFKRVVFHEITKEAIDEAFQHTREIDINLVDAQTARRVLDRLVGYKLSPMLWRKVRRGLSAGRVQSIALRLIVEREREIEKFQKEQYFSVHATITKQLPVVFDLIEINNEKIESQQTFELYDGQYKVGKTTIQTEKAAQNILADIKGKPFTIADVVQKEAKRSPQPPYTTSTLQQDASRRFGFAGKRTMSIAQKLYEEGFITYHRTDSVVLAQSAVTSMRGYIQKQFGDRYVPEGTRMYSGKQKLAQEAHEAIRPTKVTTSQQVVAQELGADFAKVYDMIWKRAVASQMTDALIESTTVLADTKGAKDSYRFKATGSVLVFDGFLKINPQALADNRLPEFTLDESLKADEIIATPHETPAPPRYNDASIIKTLEEKGIGRPSTYATIIGTIQDRQYIDREEGRFVPTAIGMAVNDFLVKNFSEIDDVPFTADMEDDLDNIAHGKKQWVPIMKTFYQPFAKKLKEVESAERVKIEVEETDQTCDKCGAPLVVRTGKFGKFLSCSTFPDCDFSKPFVEETNYTCPKDGGKIIVKKTKKGRKFFGCGNYPNCDFAVWKLEDIAKGTSDTQQATSKTKNTKLTKKTLHVTNIVRGKRKS